MIPFTQGVSVVKNKKGASARIYLPARIADKFAHGEVVYGFLMRWDEINVTEEEIAQKIKDMRDYVLKQKEVAELMEKLEETENENTD